MNLICLMDLILLQTSKTTLIYHQKHEILAKNSPVQIYPNKIKNRIVFKVKTGYKLKLLSSETMKILGTTKKIVLVHCNLVNNNCQQASKVLFTFAPNKQFGQLIDISPYSLTKLSTTNPKFSSLEVWFTDQDSEPLEIGDNVNMTLIIG